METAWLNLTRVYIHGADVSTSAFFDSAPNFFNRVWFSMIQLERFPPVSLGMKFRKETHGVYAFARGSQRAQIGMVVASVRLTLNTFVQNPSLWRRK
jgi:hypothetical protein